MKAMARFFLSLKTAFGLFLLFVLIAFVGSLMLPKNLAFFSGIDDTPLFKWLSAYGKFNLTWWIYALILMLALLAVSTIFCTVEGLLKMPGRRNLILKLSPQIMHIGVLFIMLGHLLTASVGFRSDVLIKKGSKEAIGGGRELYLNDVKAETDKNGYYTDWAAELSWLEGGREIRKTLRPVHPLYIGGLGLYFKSVDMTDEPSALIRVCRDPGALWAFMGGILISAGGLGFIYGRFSAG
jgi:hypothetical protein